MKHDFTNDISCYLARLQATIGKLDKNEINTFINLLIEARDQDRQIFIKGKRRQRRNGFTLLLRF